MLAVPLAQAAALNSRDRRGALDYARDMPTTEPMWDLRCCSLRYQVYPQFTEIYVISAFII